MGKHTKGPWGIAYLIAAATDMLEALEVAELRSIMQSEMRDGKLPDCKDPRYDRFIGPYDGYKAPEQRFLDLSYKARELRRAAIKKAKGKGE